MTEVLSASTSETSKQLIAAMRDNPADTTLRLAYADFLDEFHGQETPRSKLIRGWWNSSPDGKVNAHTVSNLSKYVGCEIAAHLGPYYDSYSITRDNYNGFCEQVTVASETWAVVGDTLLDREPVTQVTLTDIPVIEFGRSQTISFQVGIITNGQMESLPVAQREHIVSTRDPRERSQYPLARVLGSKAWFLTGSVTRCALCVGQLNPPHTLTLESERVDYHELLSLRWPRVKYWHFN